MEKVYSFIVPDRRERIAATIYVPIHMVVMQFLLALVFLILEYVLDLPVDLMALNMVFQIVACVYLVAFMFRYLKRSWTRFIEYGRSNLWLIPAGYGILMLLSITLGGLLGLLVPDLPSPNQEAVEYLAGQNFWSTFVLAVILAPVVEELLFRGALFAPFLKRGRLLAYTISALSFGFLHIVSFVLFEFSPILFVTMLIYVPHSIALCWVYEKSGSIWTAIFLHAFNNAIALLLVLFLGPYIPYI